MRSPNPGGRPRTRGYRNDGVENLVTSLGSAVDRGANNRIASLTKESVTTMDAYWSSSILLTRVIERPVDSALPYVLPDEIIAKPEAKALHESFTEALRTAAYYDRAYGGSALLVVTEDNTLVGEPLMRARAIVRVVALSPDAFKPGDSSADPFDPAYGQPTFFKIGDTEVHASRILQLGDVVAPSAAQLAKGAIEWYLGALGSTSSLVNDFSQTIYRIKGLAEILAAGNGTAVKDRVAAVDKSRSALRAILLDGETESFERQTVSLAGLPEAVRLFAEYMSAACEIPLTMLLGLPPAGLTNSGDVDRQYWADTVGRVRARLTPAVRWFDTLAQMVGAPALGDIVWSELNPATEDQLLDRQLKQAQINEIKITSGVLDPAAVGEE